MHIRKFCCTFAQFFGTTSKKTIMESLSTPFVYQPKTIEFVTSAVQLCLLLEHTAEMTKAELIEHLLDTLPLVYLKAHQLPSSGIEADDQIQHFVLEDDYNYVLCGLKQQLQSDDTYLSVLEDGRYTDCPNTAFISEDLADIYQELKDMAGNFQTKNEMVMTNAVELCRDMFRQHWGQKCLQALSALHAISIEEREDA